MRTIPWTRYLLALIITVAIFATAMLISNYSNAQRVAQIRSIEDSISIDILSLETQFDLLQEQSCSDIKENSILSTELDSLGRKLAYTEARLGVDNEEVVRLKRFYSLLEIKDLLLMKKVSEKCDDLEPIFLLYFYSNEGDCPDCTRQGYVLTELAKRYPQLRIYSFDYHLDLSAVETLISLREIDEELPALVIEDASHHGYKSLKDIEEIIPALLELAEEVEENTEEDFENTEN